MRVLLLGPLPPETGGVASHVGDLAVSLARRSHSVTVIARLYPRARREVEPTEGLLGPGVRVRRLPDVGFSRARWVKEIALEAPRHDIIHAHTFRLGCLATMFRKDVPLVVTVHGYLSREMMALDGRYSYWRDVLYRSVESYVARVADGLIAVDTKRAQWISDIGKRNDVAMVPNGILPERFPHSIPRDQRDGFVAVRHLHPYYGLEFAIRAMALVSSEYTLRIVGAGPLRVTLENLIRDLRCGAHILLLGERSRQEVLSLTSRAIAAVVPSIPVSGVEEASSVAALEAMVCGTPVIATRVGGLREIIRDGETGLLVEPGDHRAIARSMERVATDVRLWNALSRSGRDYVMRNHSWHILARKIEAIYARVIASQRRRG